MSNDQQKQAFNELERRVAKVGGPMIRSYHVREVILTHGYDATDKQIEDVLFGDD
jgi:hypothetical protein